MDDALKSIGDKAIARLPARRPAPARLRRTDADGRGRAHRRGADVPARRPDCQFICFIDICGADYPEREKRFDVVYHLLSPKLNRRIRVKIETDEATPVPSAVSVFPGRRLVRARGLRPLRRAVRRPSGPAPHPDRLRLRRPSAAQGLPDDRLRRGSLRRRGEARALRAGAAQPGIPRSSIS